MNKIISHIKWNLDIYLPALLPFTLVVLLACTLVTAHAVLGIFPFGPQQEVRAKVQRLYVDVSGSTDSTKSHYMVGTDKGVFEVSNSLLLWIWDADKRYSQLQSDKEYKLLIKGNEIVNFLFQEYPQITSVEPIN